MKAFLPQGPIESFTGATSAPTSVQPKGATIGEVQEQQFVLTNTDGSNDCCVGWGKTDASAKLNAVAGTSMMQYWLLHGTQVVVTAPVGSFFSGITGSSTAVIKVQAGLGN